MDRLFPPQLPKIQPLPTFSRSGLLRSSCPPSVCPKPQSTHLGSLCTRSSKADCPGRPEAPVFLLQYPQSLGETAFSPPTPGVSPWQRTTQHLQLPGGPTCSLWARHCLQRRPGGRWEVGDQRSTGGVANNAPGSQASARLWAVSSRPGLPGLERQGGNFLFLDCGEGK